jgi:hypothetical protein
VEYITLLFFGVQIYFFLVTKDMHKSVMFTFVLLASSLVMLSAMPLFSNNNNNTVAMAPEYGKYDNNPYMDNGNPEQYESYSDGYRGDNNYYYYSYNYYYPQQQQQLPQQPSNYNND